MCDRLLVAGKIAQFGV